MLKLAVIVLRGVAVACSSGGGNRGRQGTPKRPSRCGHSGWTLNPLGDRRAALRQPPG
jgi:hypothetical protein